MHCYIYYKSEVKHAEQILACVEQLRIYLLDRLSQAIVLQRRPCASNDLYTWMESYSEIPDEFERLLKEAVAQSNIHLYITGERHLEYFLTV
jgi:hypothetical protein